MKVTVIHGQNHRGSTYHITKLFLEKLRPAQITEFFLPSDASEFCVGCFRCFMQGEESCPHAGSIQPIAKAMEEADVLVFDSPCYVMDMSGQMKAFLDHLGYRCMVHRPHPAMFQKTAVLFSTAAGSGTKPTLKSMGRSMFHWGIAKVYRYGRNVAAKNWEEVKPSLKPRIHMDLEKLAQKVRRKGGKAKPGIKTKGLFAVMRLMMRSNTWNPKDREYWEEQGWLGKKRPWKVKMG